MIREKKGEEEIAPKNSKLNALKNRFAFRFLLPMSGDMQSDEVTEIDGSQGEGGGEILRNCIAYSTILGKAISVTKIRAGRPKPGLRPQHLQGILLARDLCRAKVQMLQFITWYILS